MWRVPEGPEGTGEPPDAGPGCGGRGRWRGLAGLRDDAPSTHEQRSAAAHGYTKQPGPAGGRALRRPEHPWGAQTKTSGTGRRHDPRLGRQGTQSCNPESIRNVGGATRPGHAKGGPDERNDILGGPAQAS